MPWLWSGVIPMDLRKLLNYDGLGLHSTWMETMESAPTGAETRAHQYLGEVDTYDWDPSLDLYGGGGLASTPDDMATFMRAVFTRGLYMRAATADTMLTTVAADRGGNGLIRRTKPGKRQPSNPPPWLRRSVCEHSTRHSRVQPRDLRKRQDIDECRHGTLDPDYCAVAEPHSELMVPGGRQERPQLDRRTSR